MGDCSTVSGSAKIITPSLHKSLPLFFHPSFLRKKKRERYRQLNTTKKNILAWPLGGATRAVALGGKPRWGRSSSPCPLPHSRAAPSSPAHPVLYGRLGTGRALAEAAHTTQGEPEPKHTRLQGLRGPEPSGRGTSVDAMPRPSKQDEAAAKQWLWRLGGS